MGRMPSKTDDNPTSTTLWEWTDNADLVDQLATAIVAILGVAGLGISPLTMIAIGILKGILRLNDSKEKPAFPSHHVCQKRIQMLLDDLLATKDRIDDVAEPPDSAGGRKKITAGVAEFVDEAPGEFTASDVCQFLKQRNSGHDIKQSSVSSALSRLKADGAIEVVAEGGGRRGSTYRRVPSDEELARSAVAVLKLAAGTKDGRIEYPLSLTSYLASRGTTQEHEEVEPTDAGRLNRRLAPPSSDSPADTLFRRAEEASKQWLRLPAQSASLRNIHDLDSMRLLDYYHHSQLREDLDRIFLSFAMPEPTKGGVTDK